jgi:hypothetical protein
MTGRVPVLLRNRMMFNELPGFVAFERLTGQTGQVGRHD